MQKENPFITAFGITDENTYIARVDEEDRIINDFSQEVSTTNAYMIAGVRGMGKTVFMTHVSNRIAENDDSWIVVNLSSQNDLLRSLAANLQARPFLDSVFIEKKLDFSLLGIGLSIQGGSKISDEEVMVRRMLSVVKTLKKRVLVTIDEVSNQDNIRRFASSFQLYVRERLPIYLIMTGLYKNIRSLQSSKNMTFLKRTPRIDINTLGLNSIAKKYEALLDVPFERAAELSKITNGYAYAYSLLGNLLWDSNDKKDISNVIKNLKNILEERSYDQIWAELTDVEKEFIVGMAESEADENGNILISDVIKRIGKSNTLVNEYRNRLIDNGLVVSTKYGCVAFSLPFFSESVNRLKLF